MTALEKVPGNGYTPSTSVNGNIQDECNRISVLYVVDEPCLLDVAKIFLESDGGLSVRTSESATSVLDILEKM